MKDGIILSDKHGVNPGMLLCPICMKEIGIALYGRLKDDAEAPMRNINNEPCDDCKKIIDKGYIALIAAKKEANGIMFLGDHIFLKNNSELCKQLGIAQGKIAFCDKEFIEKIKENYKKIHGEDVPSEG